MQLRQFLHPTAMNVISRTLARQRPKFRVVVLHDNLGAIDFALAALGVDLELYWCADRWHEIHEINDANVRLLKNAHLRSEQKWAASGAISFKPVNCSNKTIE